MEKIFKIIFKIHIHFLLRSDSFPEKTYRWGLLTLAGKALLFPGVYGNPVPRC